MLQKYTDYSSLFLVADKGKADKHSKKEVQKLSHHESGSDSDRSVR